MENRIKSERLKGWILGIVNGIDANLLVQMIKDNEMPILWEYELPPYLSFAGALIAEYKDSILEQLNFKNVMIYAKQYRQDLARILQHPAGKKWMTRFLRMISFMIENSELDAYEMAAKFKHELARIKEKREREQANQVALMLEQESLAAMEKEKQELLVAEKARQEILEAEAEQRRKIAELPSKIPTQESEVVSEPEPEVIQSEIKDDSGKYNKENLYDYI